MKGEKYMKKITKSIQIFLVLIFMLSFSQTCLALIKPEQYNDRVTIFYSDFEDKDDSMWQNDADKSRLVEVDSGTNTAYQVYNYDYLKVPNIDTLVDFRVEFNYRFKLKTPGENWPAFYLKSRGQPSRYELYFESKPGAEAIELKKSLQGKVKSVPYDVSAINNKWVYIKIDITGDKLTCYINDKEKPAFEYQDDDPIDCGPLGFVKGGCAGNYVDNLLVTVPQGSAPEGPKVIPGVSNEYGGVYAEVDFENGSQTPFTDVDGKNEIIDYRGSKALKIGGTTTLGDSTWKNYSVEFDMSILNRTYDGHESKLLDFRYLDDKNYYRLSIPAPGASIAMSGAEKGQPIGSSDVGYSIDDLNPMHWRIDCLDGKYAIYTKNQSFQNMEYPILQNDEAKLTNGGLVFYKADNVEQLIIDNVKITEISKSGTVGSERPDYAPFLPNAPKKIEGWTDMQGHWAYDTVGYLAQKGIFNGYGETEFAPENTMEVREFIKAVVSALGLETEKAGDGWETPYIEAAKKKGLIADGDFDRYDRPITRLEMAEILVKAMGESTADYSAYAGYITDYASIPADKAQYVLRAVAEGLITGYEDGSFGGNGNAARCEAAEMIMRLVVPAYRKAPGTVSVKMKEYDGAFRNPLKGYVDGLASLKSNRVREYSSILHWNVEWKDLENAASDGVEKIKEYTNEQLKDVPANNMKMRARVYLEWPGTTPSWPADLTAGDYTSAEFQERLAKFIEKLGEAWDTDPRIGFIEMGIIGLWGEMQSPYPTPEVAKILGDSFTSAFKNKKVEVNLYNCFNIFKDYKNFGNYWDSYGHNGNLYALEYFRNEATKDIWKTARMSGETAYDWGETLGKDVDDGVLNFNDRYAELIRGTHLSDVSWLTVYSKDNEEIAKAAARLQKLMGYRYVIDRAVYPETVSAGENLSFRIAVKNTASAPMYGNWPIEVSLLDVQTKAPVWKTIYSGADITKWLPADDYSYEPLYSEDINVQLPPDIAQGEYILALAVADPEGGMMPCLRFANENYFNGGRTPVGRIGVGMKPSQTEISPETYDDIFSDNSLYYVVD